MKNQGGELAVEDAILHFEVQCLPGAERPRLACHHGDRHTRSGCHCQKQCAFFRHSASPCLSSCSSPLAARLHISRSTDPGSL